MPRPPNNFGRKHGVSSAMQAIEAGLVHADLARAIRPHMATVYWDDVVGPQVAGATQVLAVRGGDTLVVRTKNGVWANELTLLKTDILKRLNRAIGGKVLADIRFEIGVLDRRTEAPADVEELPDPADIDATPLPPGSLRRISAAASAITDPDLAIRVRRSLERIAQAEAWKTAHGWIPCPRCTALTSPAEASSDGLCAMCRVVKPGP